LSALVILVGVPRPASAGVLQYCPSGSCAASAGDANDIGDLDHHNFYTWKLSGLNLGGQNVSKAQISFKQLYNWDANANELFLQLLDTAKSSGGTLVNSATGSGYTSLVQSYQDETLDQGPMSDVFNNTASIECYGLTSTALTACQTKQSQEATQVANLVASGTTQTALTHRSFADLGTYPTFTPGEVNPAGWSVVADGNLNGEPLYTYTYTFTDAQETALQSYINNGGNIAIGLDPDCHFYNNGVMLTITTGNPVPEPAALLLFAPALAYAWHRRKAARAASL
jgi:hypothetical protein